MVRAAAATAFCLLLAAGTLDYNRHWMREEALWRHAVVCEPLSFRAHVNVGSYDYLAGRHAKARNHFERAVEIRPDNPRALYNLANAYKKLRRYREAADLYRKAADLGLESATETLHEMTNPTEKSSEGRGFSRHLSGHQDTKG